MYSFSASRPVLDASVSRNPRSILVRCISGNASSIAFTASCLLIVGCSWTGSFLKWTFMVSPALRYLVGFIANTVNSSLIEETTDFI